MVYLPLLVREGCIILLEVTADVLHPSASLGQEFLAYRLGVKKRKTNNVSQVSLYSKNTTLILCIFLGMFGMHRFYVKKSGTGILWMFSFGLFLFGWISDIISILNGTFTDGLGRSLR